MVDRSVHDVHAHASAKAACVYLIGDGLHSMTHVGRKHDF